MSGQMIYSGFVLDGTTLTSDAMNVMSINGANPIQSTVPQTTVSGSAGSYTWCQPVSGASWKKIIVRMSGYTNLSSSVITFPIPFVFTPAVMVNGSGLSIATMTATALTIPIATTASGFIILEGF